MSDVNITVCLQQTFDLIVSISPAWVSIIVLSCFFPNSLDCLTMCPVDYFSTIDLTPHTLCLLAPIWERNHYTTPLCRVVITLHHFAEWSLHYTTLQSGRYITPPCREVILTVYHLPALVDYILTSVYIKKGALTCGRFKDVQEKLCSRVVRIRSRAVRICSRVYDMLTIRAATPKNDKVTRYILKNDKATWANFKNDKMTWIANDK